MHELIRITGPRHPAYRRADHTRRITQTREGTTRWIRAGLTASLAAFLLSYACQAPAQDSAATGDEKVPLEAGFGIIEKPAEPRTSVPEALRDTRFDVHLRTYYLDRNKFDDTESEAWALGGWAGLKTGYIWNHLALGATAYTSQKLHGPDDKDGTLLLAPGQESYTVLGEAYGQVLLTQYLTANLGLKRLDTPYINSNDNRMTPNTFEAYTIHGLYGGTEEQARWRFGAGYINEIKDRNSDDFVSMATDAGAPEGVEEGVWAAGLNFAESGFSLGAVNYLSDDIINIFYTEATYAMPLRDDRTLRFAAQYTDQESTGDHLLTGDSFSTNQFGLRAELALGPTTLTAAYTSTGSGDNMRSPWSSYPGYTSVQVQDFNRAGEDAWMLRAAYRFQGLEGLSIYGLWVNGSEPDAPGQFAQEEFDLNAEYALGKGPLAGLKFRLRYAVVEESGGSNADLDDFRFIVYFDPAAL